MINGVVSAIWNVEIKDLMLIVGDSLEDKLCERHVFHTHARRYGWLLRGC